MDKNYRMTVSRDRLAEFRRNSAFININNNNQQPQQQRSTLPPQPLEQQSLALYYNGHTESYHQPPAQPYPTYVNPIPHREKFELAPPQHQQPYQQYPRIVNEKQPQTSTEEFFLQIEDIKILLGQINANVTEIESLHTASLCSINLRNSNQINQELENLVYQTSKLNQNAKNRIRDIEINSAKLALNPSDRLMRTTQLQALKKKFVETIQRYQDIERAFKRKHREHLERQIRIVKPEATIYEIEAAIDSNEPVQIFAYTLLSRMSNANQILNEVHTRHTDIKKIEKTILELHQLFLDMQNMIEMQQETLEKIDNSADNAMYDLEQGNKHVDVAVKTAKMTRKTKLFCLMIFIVFLVVAAVLIWWFAFPNSHTQK